MSLRQGTAGNVERMGQAYNNECVWIGKVEVLAQFGVFLELVVFEEEFVHLCQIDGVLLRG